MQKSDYIYIIIDNLSVYGTKSPEIPQGEQLYDYLSKFNEDFLKIIAGFNRKFLEHFFIVYKVKDQRELTNTLKKMEIISHMVGPTGNLSFLSPHQLEFILNKLDSLELKEISEKKISLIVDEQLQKEFGGSQYSTSDALENQLASAAFYLISMGYSEREIEEKFSEVRQDPSKLDALFNMPQKEIYSMPAELEQASSSSSESQEITIDHSQETEKAIDQAINSIHQEMSEERTQKVDEIMVQIKAHVKEKLTDQHERVFRQIHPDRLNHALKLLKQTKRKSKRMELLLDWFLCSHLLSGIELKVEHWQVSSQASRSQAGVYTAGIDFSRYDNIIKEFPDSKLSKVINLSRKILQNPTKRAIQKLGQDLIATTGFDEHLYFTD
jgi:hypothetical protein